MSEQHAKPSTTVVQSSTVFIVILTLLAFPIIFLAPTFAPKTHADASTPQKESGAKNPLSPGSNADTSATSNQWIIYHNPNPQIAGKPCTYSPTVPSNIPPPKICGPLYYDTKQKVWVTKVLKCDPTGVYKDWFTIKAACKMEKEKSQFCVFEQGKSDTCKNIDEFRAKF
ncbi:hypothetical protein BCR33DRAFT_730678 [Rhizoclosmatium globosum]|uniref:Uncharacterized protein n=1 Tax=Rhizoclosmatium globosum TaxID=329046 RepID=A0A1Y2ABM3_9FUNG|nr:hypothetical protein BCR33DRAFT_730678 [Rhizoclosmatium globosum]|eukprot:ORY19916.1 hypothetical protein BCR33DRAFT_730678 [Rhizoclosmatium globosum]